MKHGSMKMPPIPAGSDNNADVNACPLPQSPDLSGIAVVALHPHPSPADYLAAMSLAQARGTSAVG